MVYKYFNDCELLDNMIRAYPLELNKDIRFNYPIYMPIPPNLFDNYSDSEGNIIVCSVNSDDHIQINHHSQKYYPIDIRVTYWDEVIGSINKSGNIKVLSGKVNPIKERIKLTK